jgi:hypothetical protein
MKRKIIFSIIPAVLLLINAFVIVHILKVKQRNKNLFEELSAIYKMAGQPEQDGAIKQDAKDIERMLQELEYGSFVKHLEIKKQHIHLQLEGISQEQLFMFFKVLSEQSKHRLLQCNISKHGSSLALIAEIQLL